MAPSDAHMINDIMADISASPSPFHVVETVASALAAEGFVGVNDHEPWPTEHGGFYLRRNGAIVAWAHQGQPAEAGFRIIGAHTDSPNLRLKPQPGTSKVGLAQVGVEVYGGVLLNSWLDRELGLSGRVVVRDGDDQKGVLVHTDDPLFVIPQLAIHLDREISTTGLLLNKQQHMAPIGGFAGSDDAKGAPEQPLALIAELADVDPADVLSHELMLHDVRPPQIYGYRKNLLAAPRIDNQLSCFVAQRVLTATAETPDSVPMIALFDHEEVGSTSASGAGSPLLASVLERSVSARGGDHGAFRRAIANSLLVSADGAHATHPNYADRHEPDHQIALNAGPVLKYNANERYATTAETAAAFRRACDRAGVPVQEFVTRTDLACGSTIGPISAAELGMATVDVGCPQLAMHSARETCGTDDAAMFHAALVELFTNP
ncbi:MAG: M18 family aminopeptidase [Acidimicrobiales bacterium]|nr:M18 family aminopeptidase [Acidimicrobiales bacterium]